MSAYDLETLLGLLLTIGGGAGLILGTLAAWLRGGRR